MSAPAPRHIDDLGRPRLPLPIQLLNALARPAAPRLARLDEDRLLAAARRRTGLEDFDEDGFREPLRALLEALEREARLSALGRALARQTIIGLLVTRLRLRDLVRRHPGILDEPIEEPIVIAGLPRTGTTHLHNLMAQDPALRFLPYWESLEPIPPADGAPDARLRRCEQALRLVTWVMPLFPLMHEMSARGPHEEIQLLAVAFSTMLFEATYHVPGFRDWYRTHDQVFAYRTLRRLLQCLQWSGHERRRWVLKSPQHLEQLGPLLRVFPDARVIQTHRDPVAITASLCTMIAYGRRMQADAVDPLTIGRYWAKRAEDLLRASVDDRHLVPRERITDVRFHEYMADQPGTLERLYAFARQPMTDAARRAIRAFIDANPRGKLGRIDYRLEDFGLDARERRAALRFYQERFAVADE